MSRKRGDPRWIILRLATRCSGCGARLEAGTESFYFPESQCYAGYPCGCGDDAERDYSAEMFDEEEEESYH